MRMAVHTSPLLLLVVSSLSVTGCAVHDKMRAVRTVFDQEALLQKGDWTGLTLTFPPAHAGVFDELEQFHFEIITREEETLPATAILVKSHSDSAWCVYQVWVKPGQHHARWEMKIDHSDQCKQEKSHVK